MKKNLILYYIIFLSLNIYSQSYPSWWPDCLKPFWSDPCWSHNKYFLAPLHCPEDYPYVLVFEENFDENSIDNIEKNWEFDYQGEPPGVVNGQTSEFNIAWFANKGTTPPNPLSHNIELTNGQLNDEGKNELKLIARNENPPINGTWCDYVFDKTYNRMSFEEKEKYVMENRHLPDIASDNEVKNNGMNVTMTINGTIKNTEENTLDIIELHKLILSQQETLKAQQNMLKAQQTKIDELEKIIKNK